MTWPTWQASLKRSAFISPEDDARIRTLFAEANKPTAQPVVTAHASEQTSLSLSIAKQRVAGRGKRALKAVGEVYV